MSLSVTPAPAPVEPYVLLQAVLDRHLRRPTREAATYDKATGNGVEQGAALHIPDNL